MKQIPITTIAAVLLVGCWKPNIWQAAETGRIKDVNRHLDEGMGVNAKDPYGRTTIHYAAQRGHKEIIEMLIAKGADINAMDKYGWTPLYYAAGGTHKEIVELLIDNGADVNAKEPDGVSPLRLGQWRKGDNRPPPQARRQDGCRIES